MNFRSLRIASGLVCFIFLVTSINPVAYAMTPKAEVSPVPFKTLEIPAEFGQVTETVMGDAKAPILIHIQSAHGNYEAEKNIENLLGYIEKNSKVRTMFLEGAANKLQPELFRIFPDHPDFNRQVTDKLMQEGYLTGPENFLINQDSGWRMGDGAKQKAKTPSALRHPSSGSMQAFGMEDLDAYKKDRDAFIKVVKADKATQTFLRQLRADLEKRFTAKLNKDLLDLVRQEDSLDAGMLPFEGWLKALNEASQKYLKQDLSDAFYQNHYPFLVRYFRLRSIGAKIDQDKATREAEDFLKELEKRGIAKEIIALFHQDGGGRKEDGAKPAFTPSAIHHPIPGAGFSPLRRAFDLLFNEAPKDFSMKAWPNWTLYAQYMILMQEMESKGLHDETTQLKTRIAESLAKTADEKAYLVEARDLSLLRKLFALELTRKEYEEFRDSYLAPRDSKTQGEFRVPSPELRTLFATAMSFYSTAIVREQKMFANALKKMGDAKEQRAVLVTGGFHAEGIKKLATERSCSYLQITPRIQEVTQRDHEVYLKSMLGTREFETSQIAALLGLVNSTQRIAVTGRDEAKRWLSSIGDMIREMISLQPLSLQPVYVQAYAASSLSRAEVRKTDQRRENARMTALPPSRQQQPAHIYKGQHRVGKTPQVRGGKRASVAKNRSELRENPEIDFSDPRYIHIRPVTDQVKELDNFGSSLEWATMPVHFPGGEESVLEKIRKSVDVSLPGDLKIETVVLWRNIEAQDKIYPAGLLCRDLSRKDHPAFVLLYLGLSKPMFDEFSTAFIASQDSMIELTPVELPANAFLQNWGADLYLELVPRSEVRDSALIEALPNYQFYGPKYDTDPNGQPMMAFKVKGTYYYVVANQIMGRLSLSTASGEIIEIGLSDDPHGNWSTWTRHLANALQNRSRSQISEHVIIPISDEALDAGKARAVVQGITVRVGGRDSSDASAGKLFAAMAKGIANEILSLPVYFEGPGVAEKGAVWIGKDHATQIPGTNKWVKLISGRVGGSVTVGVESRSEMRWNIESVGKLRSMQILMRELTQSGFSPQIDSVTNKAIIITTSPKKPSPFSNEPAKARFVSLSRAVEQETNLWVRGRSRSEARQSPTLDGRQQTAAKASKLQAKNIVAVAEMAVREQVIAPGDFEKNLQTLKQLNGLVGMAASLIPHGTRWNDILQWVNAQIGELATAGILALTAIPGNPEWNRQSLERLKELVEEANEWHSDKEQWSSLMHLVNAKTAELTSGLQSERTRSEVRLSVNALIRIADPILSDTEVDAPRGFSYFFGSQGHLTVNVFVDREKRPGQERDHGSAEKILKVRKMLGRIKSAVEQEFPDYAGQIKEKRISHSRGLSGATQMVLEFTRRSELPGDTVKDAGRSEARASAEPTVSGEDFYAEVVRIVPTIFFLAESYGMTWSEDEILGVASRLAQKYSVVTPDDIRQFVADPWLADHFVVAYETVSDSKKYSVARSEVRLTAEQEKQLKRAPRSSIAMGLMMGAVLGMLALSPFAAVAEIRSNSMSSESATIQYQNSEASAFLTKLGDKNSDMWWASTKALKTNKDPRAVPSLIEASKNAMYEMTNDLKRMITVPRILASLVGVILSLSGFFFVRHMLRKAGRYFHDRKLAEIRAHNNPRAIRRALHNPHWDVRQSAAVALGELKDLSAVPALIIALQDNDYRVRQAVAGALGEIKDPSAIPAIINAFKKIGSYSDSLIHVFGDSRDLFGALKRLNALSELGKELNSPDWHLREAAAKALAEIKDLSAVPRLIIALKDSFLPSRVAVVRALESLNALTELGAELSSPHHDVRSAAIKALRVLKAAPEIATALNDNNSLVRKDAVDALRSLNALPELIGALHNPHWDVRQSAAKALGEIKDLSAVPALILALEDSSYHVRQAFVGALKNLNALSELGKQLSNPHWDIRFAAIDALRELKAVPEIVTALDDDSDSVRKAAVNALRSLKATSEVGAALDDDHEYVRKATVDALRSLNAVSELGEGLSNPHIDVRIAAVNALRELKSVSDLNKEWNDWFDSTDLNSWRELYARFEYDDVRGAAVEVLGEVEGSSSVPMLMEILKHNATDTSISVAAVEALGRIGDPRAVPALIESISSAGYHSPTVLQALGEFKDPQAVSVLVDAIKRESSSYYERAAAAKALGKSGDPRAVPALIEGLKMLHAPFAVSEALGELKDPRAVPVLLDVLKYFPVYQEKATVRSAAARALGKIGDPRAVRGLTRALKDRNEWLRSSAASALKLIEESSKKTARSEVRLTAEQEKQLKRVLKNLEPDWLDRLFVEEGASRRAIAFEALFNLLQVPESDWLLFWHFIQKMDIQALRKADLWRGDRLKTLLSQVEVMIKAGKDFEVVYTPPVREQGFPGLKFFASVSPMGTLPGERVTQRESISIRTVQEKKAKENSSNRSEVRAPKMSREARAAQEERFFSVAKMAISGYGAIPGDFAKNFVSLKQLNREVTKAASLISFNGRWNEILDLVNTKVEEIAMAGILALAAVPGDPNKNRLAPRLLKALVDEAYEWHSDDERWTAIKNLADAKTAELIADSGFPSVSSRSEARVSNAAKLWIAFSGIVATVALFLSIYNAIATYRVAQVLQRQGLDIYVPGNRWEELLDEKFPENGSGPAAKASSRSEARVDVSRVRELNSVKKLMQQLTEDGFEPEIDSVTERSLTITTSPAKFLPDMRDPANLWLVPFHAAVMQETGRMLQIRRRSEARASKEPTVTGSEFYEGLKKSVRVIAFAERSHGRDITETAILKLASALAARHDVLTEKVVRKSVASSKHPGLVEYFVDVYQDLIALQKSPAASRSEARTKNHYVPLIDSSLPFREYYFTVQEGVQLRVSDKYRGKFGDPAGQLELWLKQGSGQSDIPLELERGKVVAIPGTDKSLELVSGYWGEIAILKILPRSESRVTPRQDFQQQEAAASKWRSEEADRSKEARLSEEFRPGKILTDSSHPDFYPKPVGVGSNFNVRGLQRKLFLAKDEKGRFWAEVLVTHNPTGFPVIDREWVFIGGKEVQEQATRVMNAALVSLRREKAEAFDDTNGATALMKSAVLKALRSESRVSDDAAVAIAAFSQAVASQLRTANLSKPFELDVKRIIRRLSRNISKDANISRRDLKTHITKSGHQDLSGFFLEVFDDLTQGRSTSRSEVRDVESWKQEVSDFLERGRWEDEASMIAKFDRFVLKDPYSPQVQRFVYDTLTLIFQFHNQETTSREKAHFAYEFVHRLSTAIVGIDRGSDGAILVDHWLRYDHGIRKDRVWGAFATDEYWERSTAGDVTLSVIDKVVRFSPGGVPKDSIRSEMRGDAATVTVEELGRAIDGVRRDGRLLVLSESVVNGAKAVLLKRFGQGSFDLRDMQIVLSASPYASARDFFTGAVNQIVQDRSSVRSEVRQGIDVTDLFAHGPVSGNAAEVLEKLAAHAMKQAASDGSRIDVTDLFMGGPVSGTASEVHAKLMGHAIAEATNGKKRSEARRDEAGVAELTARQGYAAWFNVARQRAARIERLKRESLDAASDVSGFLVFAEKGIIALFAGNYIREITRLFGALSSEFRSGEIPVIPEMAEQSFWERVFSGILQGHPAKKKISKLILRILFREFPPQLQSGEGVGEVSGTSSKTGSASRSEVRGDEVPQSLRLRYADWLERAAQRARQKHEMQTGAAMQEFLGTGAMAIFPFVRGEEGPLKDVERLLTGWVEIFREHLTDEAVAEELNQRAVWRMAFSGINEAAANRDEIIELGLNILFEEEPPTSQPAPAENRRSEVRAKEFLKLLAVNSADMMSFLRTYEMQMNLGLLKDGHSEGHQSLLSYAPKPTGKEKGLYWAVDFGGTNLRVMAVRFDGKGGAEKVGEPLKVRLDEMDPAIFTGTAQNLFSRFAGLVKQHFLALKASGWISSDELRETRIGFTYSYPAQLHGGAGSAIATALVKNLKIRDLVGQDIAKLFNDALAKVADPEFQNARVLAVVNDTVGTLAAAVDPLVVAAIIMGSGHNASYAELIDKIVKFDASKQGWTAPDMMINLESPDAAIPESVSFFTNIDQEMFAEENPQGKRPFEKSVGGMYLPEFFRRYLKHFVEQGELFHGRMPEALLSSWSQKSAVDPEILTQMQEGSGRDAAREVLESLGVRNFSDTDMDILIATVKAIYQRAAYLSAVEVMALALRATPQLDRPMKIAIDGSLFEHSPSFRKWLVEALEVLAEVRLGDASKAKNIELKLVKDGSGLGAAMIAAAVDASSRRAASDGAAKRAEVRTQIFHVSLEDSELFSRQVLTAPGGIRLRLSSQFRGKAGDPVVKLLLWVVQGSGQSDIPLLLERGSKAVKVPGTDHSIKLVTGHWGDAATLKIVSPKESNDGLSDASNGTEKGIVVGGTSESAKDGEVTSPVEEDEKVLTGNALGRILGGFLRLAREVHFGGNTARGSLHIVIPKDPAKLPFVRAVIQHEPVWILSAEPSEEVTEFHPDEFTLRNVKETLEKAKQMVEAQLPDYVGKINTRAVPDVGNGSYTEVQLTFSRREIEAALPEVLPEVTNPDVEGVDEEVVPEVSKPEVEATGSIALPTVTAGRFYASVVSAARKKGSSEASDIAKIAYDMTLHFGTAARINEENVRTYVEALKKDQAEKDAIAGFFAEVFREITTKAARSETRNDAFWGRPSSEQGKGPEMFKKVIAFLEPLVEEGNKEIFSDWEGQFEIVGAEERRFKVPVMPYVLAVFMHTKLGEGAFEYPEEKSKEVMAFMQGIRMKVEGAFPDYSGVFTERSIPYNKTAPGLAGQGTFTRVYLQFHRKKSFAYRSEVRQREILFSAMESGYPGTPKSGGEFDYNENLPPALVKLGQKVRLVTPNFGKKITAGKITKTFRFLLGLGTVEIQVREVEQKGVIYQFLEDPSGVLFTGLYQEADKLRGLIEAAVLSLATMELGKTADLLHVNDWQTGLVPVYASTTYQRTYEKKPVVYISHNMAYKGMYDYVMTVDPESVLVKKLVKDGVLKWGGNLFMRGDETVAMLVNLKNPAENIFHLPASAVTATPDHKDLEYFGKLALGKGFRMASMLSAVSETNLGELTLDEKQGGAAFGFEGIVAAMAAEGKTAAVFNGGGVDPETEPALLGDGYTNFKPAQVVEAHKQNKLALFSQIQKRIWMERNIKQVLGNDLSQVLALDFSKDFLIGSVGRFTPQKGFDDLDGAMLEALRHKRGPNGERVRLLFLGSPGKDSAEDARVLERLKGLAASYPDVLTILVGFDTTLANRIYAGLDAFFMPSRFEPAGIAQQIANMLGTLVIAPLVGGIKDFFLKWMGVGFPYTGYSSQRPEQTRQESLAAMAQAADVFWNQPDTWHRMMKQAAQYDGSWKSRAAAYIQNIYEPLITRSRSEVRQVSEGQSTVHATQRSPEGAQARREHDLPAPSDWSVEKGEGANWQVVKGERTVVPKNRSEVRDAGVGLMDMIKASWGGKIPVVISIGLVIWAIGWWVENKIQSWKSQQRLKRFPEAVNLINEALEEYTHLVSERWSGYSLNIALAKLFAIQQILDRGERPRLQVINAGDEFKIRWRSDTGKIERWQGSIEVVPPSAARSEVRKSPKTGAVLYRTALESVLSQPYSIDVPKGTVTRAQGFSGAYHGKKLLFRTLSNGYDISYLGFSHHVRHDAEEIRKLLKKEFPHYEVIDSSPSEDPQPDNSGQIWWSITITRSEKTTRSETQAPTTPTVTENVGTARSEVRAVGAIGLVPQAEVAMSDFVKKLRDQKTSLAVKLRTAAEVTGGILERAVTVAQESWNKIVSMFFPERLSAVPVGAMADRSRETARAILGIRTVPAASDVFVLGHEFFSQDHRVAIGVREVYPATTIIAIVKTAGERAFLKELNLRLAKESLLPILAADAKDPSELKAHLSNVKGGVVRATALLYAAETVPLELVKQIPNTEIVTPRMLKGFLNAVDMLVSGLVSDLQGQFAMARSA